MVRHELAVRIEAWPCKFDEREVQEVIGALLARQATLVIELAKAITIWNGHIAPLVLRAMVDVYISLAWVFESPSERAKKFILHGLGQAKLNLEYRKRQLQEDGMKPEEDESCRVQEMWINSQQFTFLTEVDLGAWSGKSTREMAEEAGCIGLYNYAYTPFSLASHSMWPHLEPYNLQACRNPLHGWHKKACIRKSPWHIDYLSIGAKYVNKAFKLFDKKTGIKNTAPNSYDFLWAWLHEDGDTKQADNPSGKNEAIF